MELADGSKALLEAGKFSLLLADKHCSVSPLEAYAQVHSRLNLALARASLIEQGTSLLKLGRRKNKNLPGKNSQ